MICSICQREICEDDETCALFWNLDMFSDYGLDDGDEDPYEQYEDV